MIGSYDIGRVHYAQKKKKKIIALMTCRIRDRECYELVNILNKRFSETDFRLFVYNCSPRLDEEVKENDPQTSVYNMFDAFFTDAVIVINAYPEIVFNESCGCEASRILDAAYLFSELTNMFNRFQNENIILSETTAKIQKAKSFEEIAHIMHNDDLMYTMCCILKQEYTDESVNPELESVCGSDGGFFVLYDSDVIDIKKRSGEKFTPYYMPTKDIIPALDYYLNDGRCLIFTTLHYLGVTLGYLCFHFSDFAVGNYYKIPQITSILNNALGGLINQRYKFYLMKKIEMASWIDTLTGLYNRCGFCAKYDRLLENLGDEPLEIVMYDLDGLKYINDTFGHEEGDNAIYIAATALKNVCPKDAVCTRFGGDEMLAVYPYGEKSGDIRAIFCGYLDRYNNRSGKPYKVAASMGIYVTGKGERPNFEELVKKSDVLMYEEKKRRKAAHGV